MTTLNTIIEEEVMKYKLLMASEVMTVWDDETGNEVFLPDFLTTAMQRAYEAGKEEFELERQRIIQRHIDHIEDIELVLKSHKPTPLPDNK